MSAVMKLLKSRFKYSGKHIIKAALNSAILCAALAISLAVNFSHAATNDLNGNGKSDLLARNSTTDRKSTRLNSSHSTLSRMPSSA